MRKFLKSPHTMFALGLLLLLSSWTACAWWQKHESQINCAAIASVENTPQLINIVTTCAAVAVNTAAVLPCIKAAAGSQWADDVIACFSGAVAGMATCPAIPPSASEAPVPVRDRLRAALQSQGYTFK